ncbi:MAG: MoaD/ThiS family protein [Rhodopirellula sp.]|nr:MoaD/ThiS family protein [Rhodopirellula sp.]
MKVSVRLFAVAQQIAGRDLLDLELSESATIGDLRRQLGCEVPALSPLLGPMLFAVNARYADDATLVPPDGEIACIPPASGG